MTAYPKRLIEVDLSIKHGIAAVSPAPTLDDLPQAGIACGAETVRL